MGRYSAPVYNGGLHSTAADYVKFMQMLFNGGRAPDGTRLLSEKSVELMGQPHTGNVRVELQPTTNDARTLPFPLGAGRDTYGLGFQVTGAHDDPDARSPGSMTGPESTTRSSGSIRGAASAGCCSCSTCRCTTTAAMATLQGLERAFIRSLDY